MITIQAILSGESSGQTDRASVAEQIKQFRLVAGLLSSKVRKHMLTFCILTVVTAGGGTGENTQQIGKLFLSV